MRLRGVDLLLAAGLTCVPVALGALALVLARPAQIQRTSEAQALASLKAEIDAATSAGKFAGAVRVAHNGQPIFDYVSGQAHRERGVANNIDTLFRIGSMNKMFTAVSILQLVQAGKIDLDAPVATYLPHYPTRTSLRA